MVQRIKAIKDALGISENELARRLGISQSTLNGYTLGKRKPSYDLAESVLNAFSDVSAEWLLRGDGPMYISDLPSTDHDDSDEVLELKAEITRLRAERDELVRKLAISERRIDKLIDILHQEPEPRVSMVAEGHEYNTNNSIR
jgi:transcriptional regulator with XRE-family HTH domain